MSTGVERLTERAPAKLNLYLHITGKRADGYHLINSLFVFSELADEVSAALADEFSLTVSGPFAHYLNVQDNLVMEAAKLLHEATGSQNKAALHLVKNLPVAAGLGGGSADAAAALRVLAKLWKITIAASEMKALALKLGADVPACMDSAPLFVSGIGEVMQRAPALPELYLVLINPGTHLLTADVFREFKGPFLEAPITNETRTREDFIAYLKTRFNALQQPAMHLLPSIQVMLDALNEDKQCLLARMSGSGPTCFGLFATAEQADAAAAHIQRTHPSWWVKSSRLTS